MALGVQCVMMVGVQMMPKLYVDSWDIQQQVRRNKTTCMRVIVLFVHFLV